MISAIAIERRIAAATPPNRLTTQRRLLQVAGAMRMGAAMMRFGSNLYLTELIIPANAAIWCGCDVAIKRLVIVLFVGVIVGLGFLVTNSSPKTAAASPSSTVAPAAGCSISLTAAQLREAKHTTEIAGMTVDQLIGLYCLNDRVNRR